MLLSYVKRGAYNSFVYTLGGIFTRLISFLFFPYFLSKLTLSEIGIWEFYQLLFSQGTLFLVSAAAISMTRFYLLYKDDPLKQHQALGNAFLFTLLSASIAPCIIFILYYFNVFSLASDYMIITTISISCFALFSIILSFFRVTEQLWMYLIIFCGQNILAIIGTLVGIAHNVGIKSFFYANLLSFLVFIPFFLHLFFKHHAFSLTIFKEQLKYSVPLLVYSVIFTGFFSVDRLFIQHFLGYEILGLYGILWRFGNIFQIVSTAMIDASPVIFYNAQKEKQSHFLISKLISYFCIALLSFCLIAIFGARCLIGLLFPSKYHFIIFYLPYFFLPLIILEVARIFQTGFGLALKTTYLPLITVLVLGIQTVLLFFTHAYGIFGIIAANSLAFLCYAGICYYLSSKIYEYPIIDIKKISLLCSIFIAYLTLYNVLFFFSLPWYYVLFISSSWPLTLWFCNIITQEEKDYFFSSLQKSIKKICTRKLSSIPSFHNVVYLRTDICSQEIAAGGSITHTLGVIQGFLNSGSNIICVSSAMPSMLRTIQNIYFKQLKVWPLFFFMRWKLGYLRWHLDCFFSTFFFALQTNTLFKKNSIDVIYQRYSLLNCTGVLLSRLKKIPLILEYNGSEVWVFRTWGEKQRLHMYPLATIIELINLHAADYIIVVAQALKDELITRNIDPQKVLVNPNGVDTQQFNPEVLISQRNVLRKKYDIENKFVFGFIGTFSHWHGIEVLAKMIPEVLHQQPNAHFMLIGDGILKKFLVTELQNKNCTSITFTGIIPHQHAKEYLATCDAFLSPTQPNSDGTRFFGSPTKIFEYLSMAKPIIASNLEQLSEIISPAFTESNLSQPLVVNKEVGILVPSTNVEHFVTAACMLANLSAQALKKMGTNAREKALDHYTWNNHVKNIQEFIFNKNAKYNVTKEEQYAQRASQTRSV